MRLTVLGAGPAYTDREGAAGASYLVSAGDEHLLLDLGQGSLPRLFQHVEPSQLAGVVISHLHPDHFIDLVAFRHYLHYQFRPPRRVRVLGPAALAERIDCLHAEPGFTAAAFDVEPLAEGSHDVAGFELQACLVAHTDESYAFRVQNGGSGLVYSGDCGRAEDLDPLIRPGDTLVCEISFGEGPVPEGAMHLDAPAIAALAERTRPERVLLTHLQMGFDPGQAARGVRERFNGQVEFIWPGSVVEID